MMPYGFGFEPTDYSAMLDLQTDLKILSRSCKALIKKVGRRVQQKKN